MTYKDELVQELKEQLIDAMGSESVIASIFENPEFEDKLVKILCWLVGKIVLDQGIDSPADDEYPSGRWKVKGYPPPSTGVSSPSGKPQILPKKSKALLAQIIGKQLPHKDLADNGVINK